MKNEYRKISELREWDKNPRNITKKDFERLKRQIQKLGQYKPLIVTPDGEVIGGNMRLKAYKELGITDIWVSVVEPKDDNLKMEYALSDNDRAGYYDADMLANLMPQFDIDWSEFAVDLKAPMTLDDLFPEEVIEDEIPEVPEGEPESKMGEVYQLGRHKLMCGDATKLEDVEKLMNGQKADMVFTDPPYNVNYGSIKDHPSWKRTVDTKGRLSTRRAGNEAILNDHLSDADWEKFVADYMALQLQFNKGVFYICMSNKEMYMNKHQFEKLGGHWASFIIWKKD